MARHPVLSLARYRIGRAGSRVLRALPHGVLARIVPSARVPETSLDAPLVTPGTPIRLFIGPTNSAGQGYRWARAVERADDRVGAVSMAVVPAGATYGFPVDQAVSLASYRWSRAWGAAQDEALTGFTHLLVESGRSILSDAGPAPVAELRRFAAAGQRVALVFHGSDIRDPERHRRQAWSPYADRADDDLTLGARARENRRLVRALGLPTFVSTPDLLDDLAEATWLPIVIDPSVWATREKALVRDRLIVAHAPTNARIKGSHLVEPILHRLHDEGVIEYRRIERVAADQLPARYAAADVVLDQFRLGAYGVTAIEAMAAGRLAIGHVRPEVRERVRGATGLDVPVLEADPSSIEAVLRSLAGDRADARRLVAAGEEYVATVHDGRFAASVLQEFLTG